MSIALELKEQFAELFVTGDETGKWAELYFAQSPLISEIIADPELGAVAVPKLHIHANGHGKNPIHLDKTSKPPTIHIHPNGEKPGRLETQLVDTLEKYLAETRKPPEMNSSGGPSRSVSVQDDGYSGDEKFSTGYHGHTERYDLSAGPNKTKHLKNTWGDLLANSHMKEEERLFWIDYIFEHIDKYDSKDFLRTLRVLNGISQPEMGERLGIVQSGYAKHENYSKEAVKINLNLHQALKILDKNIFRLPLKRVSDSDTKEEIIDPKYSIPFLEKFGHIKRADREKNLPGKYTLYPKNLEEQLFAVLRAEIKAVENSEMESKNLPKLENILEYLLRGTPKSEIIENSLYTSRHHKMKVIKEWKIKRYAGTIIEILGYSQQEIETLMRLPGDSYSKGANLPTETAYRIAKDEKTIGAFLKKYRENTVGTLATIAETLGLTKERVRQYESEKCLPKVALNKILTTNAYGLPVDNEGNIREDVDALICQLNENGRKANSPGRSGSKPKNASGERGR